MSFASDLRAFAEQTKEDIDTVLRAATLEISTSIVLATPVDSGRARNNWIAKLGTPARHTRLTGDVTGQKTINQITTTVSEFGGNVYYLTNNLPYIRRLEYDAWSTQAPDGMVRVSVLEYEQALKRAISKLD